MNEFKNCTVAGDGSGPVPVKNLFLDNHHIESMTGLGRVYHQPVKHPVPVIVPDKPWENGTPWNSHTAGEAIVLSPPAWNADKGVWQIWYQGGRLTLPLYAESTDGIHWTKPSLGLSQWQGSKDNNICFLWPTNGFSSGWVHNGLSVIRDDIDPDPGRRYKAVTMDEAEHGRMCFFVSPDGVSWTRTGGTVVTNDVYRLTMDPLTRTYILTQKLNILKNLPDYPMPQDYAGGRACFLSTSTDFLQWTGPRLAMYSTSDEAPFAADYIAAMKADPSFRQPMFDDPAALPAMCFSPDCHDFTVFRYEDLYLGIVTHSAETGPYGWTWEHMKSANQDAYQYPTIVSSRDMVDWNRHTREPFLKPSRVTDTKMCDYGLLQLMAPVRQGDELWFYYWGTRFTMHRWHELDKPEHPDPAFSPEARNASPASAIHLAKLRLDGFASLRGGATAGEVVTKALPVTGTSLFVNANARGGTLKAELLDDATGEVISGYSLADSVALQEDSVCAKLQWRSMADLSGLTGKPVNIRFSVQNADLYSFWFGE